MADNNETDRPEPTPNLPMVIEQPRENSLPGAFRLPASFITQLIAEREHLSVQRKLRRDNPKAAVGAYTRSADAMVRRMPTGYRHTRDA